jgi:hypothetical protein
MSFLHFDFQSVDKSGLHEALVAAITCSVAHQGKDPCLLGRIWMSAFHKLENMAGKPKFFQSDLASPSISGRRTFLNVLKPIEL